jgi:DNA-binding GntR family transcriptional regulator
MTGDGLALPALGTRRNLREEITETLRAAVISGELRPGVVYSAPSLATQFGVSPTPVREAMLDLAGEGLVDTVRNKGFRVTELSESDLDELSELRALIEVPTVRRIAAAGAGAPVLDELRPQAAEIETAAARGDLIAHVAADMEFHLRLLALAGNQHLVETVRSLRARSRIYGLRSLADRGALVPSAHEHADLLDLVAAGDARGAERLMRAHIGHVRGIWASS